MFRIVAELPSRREASRRERDRTSVGTAVLGAGPAGLTAAYVLAQRAERGVILEADAQVGGISKTVEVDGYRFDLGGHRFFTKLAPVQKMWEDVLGEEMLTGPASRGSTTTGSSSTTRSPPRTSSGVSGVWESARCALSYFWAQGARSDEAETFEEWVTQRFGKRLYDAFFRTYTAEGMGDPRLGDPVALGGAAHQELLPLPGGAHDPRPPPRPRHDADRGVPLPAARARPDVGGVRTERASRPASRCSSSIACESIRHRDGLVHSVVARDGEAERWLSVDGVVSSLALATSSTASSPRRPSTCVAAANGLRYRDFCLVALMTTEEEPFPDNWIYLHDPETRGGSRPELRRLERRPGPAGHDLPRRRVLLLRGRRDLGDARGRRDRPRDERARRASG